MPHHILATTTASISELKKNPMATVAAGEGFPVAVLNRNEPAFYCIPAAVYESCSRNWRTPSSTTSLTSVGTSRRSR